MLSNYELKQKLSYIILGQRGGQSRVKIIESLVERPYNINQLADKLDLNYRTVRHHIEMLLKHGMIGTSHTGGYGEVYFVSPELEARLPLFREIAQKLETIAMSPKLFQSVMEQTNDAVLMIDEKLDVIFWNRSAELLFGHSSEEVLGGRIPVFPDIEAIHKVLAQVSEGKKAVGLEMRARTKAGRALDLELTIDCIRDDEKRLVGWSMICMDVTERKQALEALRVSEQRYSLAQQAARIISWEWDLASDEMSWSDRPGPFLGLGAGADLGTFRKFLGHVHPDDRQIVNDAAESIRKRGREVSIEHRVTRPDGQVRWVRHTGGVIRDEKGRALKLVGIIQDITERRDAERRYARVLETSLDGFWMNDMKGRFLEVNDAYCRMTGYTRRQLLKMNVNDVEATENHAETMRHIQKLRREGSDRFETRHRRKDGSLVDIEVSATFLDSEGGRLVVFLRDITERLKAESEIRHLASFPQLNPNPILELDLSGKVLFQNASAARTLREANLKDESALLPRDMRSVLSELKKHPGSTVYRDVAVGDRVFRMSLFQPRDLQVYRVYAIDITGRVLAEEARRRSEERFRAIATQTPDHILVQDSQLRYELVVNPQLGLSEKDMIGRTDFELLSRKDAAALTAVKRKVLETGRPESVKMPLDTPAGERHYYEGTYIPRRGPDGSTDGVIGYFRDVTERVRMDEALSASEEKYRQLFKKMMTGFALHEIVLDEQGTPVDYRFLELNPAFEALTGLRAAEVAGKTVKQVLPETEVFWIETYGKVALTGRSVRFERYFAPLEKWYDVVAYSPEKGRFAVLFSDITDRKRAAEERERLYSELQAADRELQRKQDELETILSAVVAPVMVYDRNAVPVRANGAALDSLGFDPRGTDISTLLEKLKSTAEGRKAQKESLVTNRALRGETVRDVEYSFVNQRGEKRVVLSSSAPIRSGGQTVGAVTSWQDITAIRQLEEAMAESEKRFRGLFETLGLGVIFQDAGGRITHANAAAQEILGLSMDQLQGRTSMDPGWRAVHEDGTPFPGDEHPSMVALRTGKVQKEVTMGVYNPRRGGPRWICVNAVPQFRPGEDRPFEVFTTFEDITERRAASRPERAPASRAP